MDHRCRRGERCPEHQRLDDGTRVGKEINAAEGLCDACVRDLARAITALPRDYAVLNTLLGKGRADGEVVHMTKELPVPIRTHIEALQREIVTEADNWARSCADVLRVDWDLPGRARPGWVLQRACALLFRAPSVFLALREVKHTRWESSSRRVLVVRDGLDGALVLLRLHHLARVHCGQARLVHRLPVPCPRCDSMSLEREDGDDHIDCTECARRYTWDEYQKLCLILATREERRLAVSA